MQAAISHGELPNKRGSVDFRMGEPGGLNRPSFRSEYIGPESEPAELTHLSKLRKRKRSDSLSSGERNGNSPNLCRVKAVSVAS